MSLNINFYCDQDFKDSVYEPIESSKLFPKWFSNLPAGKKVKYTAVNNDPYELQIDRSDVNVKHCPGITDVLKTGYIIRSWCDFVFREDDGKLYTNWVENYYGDIRYGSHGEKQYETMPNKPIYGQFTKIMTPWAIKTDKGVSCLIIHPFWHNNKSFTTVSAVFHTDACPLGLNWFFEWNNKIQNKMDIDKIDVKTQVVPKGEPIIQIIPFYRKKYSHQINYVSKREMANMDRSQTYLTRDTILSKCPYNQFRRTLGKLF